MYKFIVLNRIYPTGFILILISFTINFIFLITVDGIIFLRIDSLVVTWSRQSNHSSAKTQLKKAPKQHQV